MIVSDDLKDFKFPCTYKPGRNSKEFEDSIDEILRKKYPEKFKKIERREKMRKSREEFAITLQTWTCSMHNDPDRGACPAPNGETLADYMREYDLTSDFIPNSIHEQVAMFMITEHIHWRDLVSYDMHITLDDMEKEALDYTYRLNRALLLSNTNDLPLHRLKHMLHPNIGFFDNMLKYQKDKIETRNGHSVYIPFKETLYLFNKLGGILEAL